MFCIYSLVVFKYYFVLTWERGSPTTSKFGLDKVVAFILLEEVRGKAFEFAKEALIVCI